MTSPLPAINRKSLVGDVIEVLRNKVNDGLWRPGDRIPVESVLADQLGIGRNTLRQAIGVLSQSQLLEVRQGDGTYVRRSLDPAETMEKLNVTTLMEQLELHRILEGEAARLAAIRRTQDDLFELQALLDARRKQSESGDSEGVYQADRKFHLRIAQSAHNRALYELYRYFASSSEARIKALSLQLNTEQDLDAHLALLQAIEQQDESTAFSVAQALFTPMLHSLSQVAL